MTKTLAELRGFSELDYFQSALGIMGGSASFSVQVATRQLVPKTAGDPALIVGNINSVLGRGWGIFRNVDTTAAFSFSVVVYEGGVAQTLTVHLPAAIGACANLLFNYAAGAPGALTLFVDGVLIATLATSSNPYSVSNGRLSIGYNVNDADNAAAESSFVGLTYGAAVTENEAAQVHLEFIKREVVSDSGFATNRAFIFSVQPDAGVGGRTAPTQLNNYGTVAGVTLQRIGDLVLGTPPYFGYVATAPFSSPAGFGDSSIARWVAGVLEGSFLNLDDNNTITPTLGAPNDGSVTVQLSNAVADGQNGGGLTVLGGTGGKNGGTGGPLSYFAGDGQPALLPGEAPGNGANFFCRAGAPGAVADPLDAKAAGGVFVIVSPTPPDFGPVFPADLIVAPPDGNGGTGPFVQIRSGAIGIETAFSFGGLKVGPAQAFSLGAPFPFGAVAKLVAGAAFESFPPPAEQHTTLSAIDVGFNVGVFDIPEGGVLIDQNNIFRLRNVNNVQFVVPGSLQLHRHDAAGEALINNGVPEDAFIHYRTDVGAGSSLEKGFRAYRDGAYGLVMRGYQQIFTAPDFVGNTLTVTHNLDTVAPIVQIYDSATGNQQIVGGANVVSIVTVTASVVEITVTAPFIGAVTIAGF